MLNVTNNNYLQELVTTAGDAYSNLYIAQFLGGVFNAQSISEGMSVRCDGFTPPSIDQPSYQVRFINEHIDRPSTKVNVTRNFSLTFRVDANYAVYKAICQQRDITFDPTRSFTATDIYELKQNNKLFSVTINALKNGLNAPTGNKSLTLFKFRDCWITRIDPLKFSYSSGDPLTVNVGINFIEMEDLQSGFGA